ncbi:MAG: anti-sigma factor [candidate division KSB1 bacterium]|nr:anti-sigma factor [candidate division KSB1 bacterium]
MSADQFTELAELYVLGTLDAKDSREFAQHLTTGCWACTQAVKEARRVIEALPYTAAPNTPPEDLKQRVLEEIAAETTGSGLRPQTAKSETKAERSASIRAMPTRTFWQRAPGPLAWAAVFLLMVVSYGYFTQRREVKQLHQHLAELNQQIHQSRASIQQLEIELARRQRFINLVKSPNLILVELKGLPIHPPGRAKIAIDPRLAQASILVYNLPPLTIAQDYQLWFIQDGKPYDAGVFHVDENGEYVGEVRNLPVTLAGITAFAVTREPKGGRPEPTLDQMYLMGPIRGG